MKLLTFHEVSRTLDGVKSTALCYCRSEFLEEDDRFPAITDVLLKDSAYTNAGGGSGDENICIMSCISFSCLVEGNKQASLARLDHGVERVEKKRTVGDEAVV